MDYALLCNESYNKDLLLTNNVINIEANGSLAQIHLLNDERGLVLECLVARALTTGLKN